MKILLAAINAKYIHSNLAVYSLKACTEHIPGIRVAVEEFTNNKYKMVEPPDIGKDIE